MSAVVSVLILAAVIYAFISLSPSAHDFVITVRPTGVSVTGKIPANVRSTIADFLQRDLAIQNAKVLGTWRTGLLRIDIRGKVGPIERQRIRNFLSVTLPGA